MQWMLELSSFRTGKKTDRHRIDLRACTSLSIIPAISVCLSVCVCVSATAVSRQPLVRSNWNLPWISLGTRGCAFSRFDINRTSGSQVTAIYLSTNDRTRCYDITIDVTIKKKEVFCTYGHTRAGTHVRACTSIYNSSNLCVSVCMCMCLRPPFLDNHWSNLIETCQEYCWGPEDVRFQGLILLWFWEIHKPA